MHEQSKVYFFSEVDGRRLPVGCGVVVEKSYLLTCRHVWEQLEVARSSVGARTIAEYPYFSRNRFTRVALVDTSGNAHPHPDVVILSPEVVPAEMVQVYLAPESKYESGDGVIFAGI